MNNFLLTVMAILVAIFAALFAVPPFIDWNAYRGVFEEEVSRLLDREVRVQGRVSVSILPVPYVSFEKVRIADQLGIPGSFVRAEKFNMWLSVPPLLRGVIEARRIELDRPVLRLRIQEDGSGNWRELQIQDHALAFLPRDVALNSLTVSDGTVILEHHSGKEITRIQAVTGEFSATALRGPFKFTGTAKTGTATHGIRFATAPLEADGNIRFRGTVREQDTNLTHTIDGVVHDPLGRAHITGRLKTRAGDERRAPSGGKQDAGAWELTAGITLDAESFALDDISMTFESQERLQTLTGSAVTSWQDGIITRTELKAPWLDLDAVAGTGKRERPLGVIERLLTRSLEPLGAGITTVKLEIEQGRLAGATVSGLDARLVRRSGITRIERLRASLPGLTALALDGFVDSGEAGLEFDGQVVLRSAKFAEFANWLAAGAATSLAGDIASPFSLSGSLRLRPSRVSVSDASASVAGETLEGALDYDATGARPRLTADIEAGSFNFAVLGDGLLEHRRLAAKLGLGMAGAPADLPLLAGTDLSVKLWAGRLEDGERVFENVVADLTRSEDHLEIARLGLVWAPGLEIDLAGRLDDLGRSPAGKLDGTIRATGEPAARNLAALVSSVLGARLPPGMLTVRAPFRLAFDATLAGRSSAATDADAYPTVIVADGETAGSRLRLTARTSGNLEGWRTQPANVDGRLEGPDALDLARWMLGDAALARDTSAAPDQKPTPATVVLSAVGVPERTMKAYARLDAGDRLAAAFTGEVAIARAEQLAARWSGTLTLDRADTVTLARVLWPPLAPRLAGLAAAGAVTQPVTGRLGVSGGGETLVLKPDRLRLAGSRLSGELTLSRTAAIAGHLDISKASLKALASLLLDETAGSARTAALHGAPVAAGEAPPWPTAPFDFTPLDGLTGDLRLSLARLLGNDGALLARDLKGRLAFDGDRVALSELAGRLGEGRLSGRLAFARTAAGTALDARIETDALPLALFAPSLEASHRLAGRAAFIADISGRALTPAALAGTVKGSGTYTITGARVPGLAPEALTALTARVVAGEIEPDGLAAQLAGLATETAIDLTAKTAAPDLHFTLQNGVVSLPPLAVAGADGRGAARNLTSVRLRDWRFESRWTVTPAAMPKPEVEGETLTFPSVTLTYEGALGRLAAIEPVIDLGDLERELVVAKMEANVARLERLRREDEERARQEAERQRQRDEEERRAREAEAARIERERAEGLRPGSAGGWQSRVRPEQPPSEVERPTRAPRPL